LKILGIILARAGSKRLPGKNTKILIDKPLIEWTVQAAVLSNIDKVILSTDCNKCKEIAKKYNVQVYDRPAHLAQDSTTSAEVILDLMDGITGYTHIMILQPTSPLRNSTDIDSMIRFYEITSKYCEKITIISTSLETLKPNGAMYMSEWDKFLSDKDFKPDYVYWMDRVKSIDIDTEEDFRKAEQILRGSECPL